MKLIVGLGNPGEKYKNTRHNIGANIAKKLAKLHNINLRSRKYSSRFGKGRIGGEVAAVILPLTYMNLSGEAVFQAVRAEKLGLSDVLVICDDANLKLGNIRIRPKGSSGGHRGLRSIVEHLGSEDFPRLRVGIGKGGDLKDHVLLPFGKDELDKVKEAEKRSADAIVSWLTKGIEYSMNRYNKASQ